MPLPGGAAGHLATMVRERWAVVLAVLVACGAGWWLLRPAEVPVEASLPMATAGAGGGTASGAGASSGGGASGGASSAAAAATASSTSAPDLVVQAAGAVRRPGVYRLAPGARVDDLVRRAGGLAPSADRDRINLAAALVDGERVWIPARGEREAPDVLAGGTGGGTAPAAGGTSGGAAGSAGSGGGVASTSAPAGPVDLNRATADQLDALPGVGPATAAAILAYRDQAGAFRSVDDLLAVRGIGEAKLEQLRPLVTV